MADSADWRCMICGLLWLGLNTELKNTPFPKNALWFLIVYEEALSCEKFVLIFLQNEEVNFTDEQISHGEK